MEIVTLSNGVRVANFSSPHAFTFEDGTILPACSNEHAEKYKVDFIEDNKFNPMCNKIIDVTLKFELNWSVMEQVQRWKNKWNNGEVDVVICPLPMLVALREENYPILYSPFRAIRMEDRIKKEISIKKFCL